MSTVSYFCVFVLLSSLIVRANCSSGKILKLKLLDNVQLLMFLGRCCVQNTLKTSYREMVREKSLLHEKTLYFVLIMTRLQRGKLSMLYSYLLSPWTFSELFLGVRR